MVGLKLTGYIPRDVVKTLVQRKVYEITESFIPGDEEASYFVPVDLEFDPEAQGWRFKVEVEELPEEIDSLLRTIHAEDLPDDFAGTVAAQLLGEEEDDDPTPYCHVCHAQRESDCLCGPYAKNH